MYKGKKSYGELVVTGSDSAIAFEFLKEIFDVMTFLVLFFVKWNNNFAYAILRHSVIAVKQAFSLRKISSPIN